MAGPLAGVKVVELQGRGPGPFGAMVLADLGADVVRIGRVDEVALPTDDDPMERMVAGRRQLDVVARGRRFVALDLKHPDGLEAARSLIDRADVLVEGYRPGVAERLGVGPDVCLERNPALVYARMTGWGQDGPLAQTPGHDINYVAVTGALHPLQRPGVPPMPPLNLLGDYGGGGMLLVTGVLAALLERGRSGLGQVVDVAMVDGVSLLTSVFHGMRAEGLWSEEPGTNVLDLGAPFYNVYETADGRYVTVGAGEPQFYAELVRRLGVPELALEQLDRSTWAAGKARLAEVFRTRTLAEWQGQLEGTEACFAPVLSFDEAIEHPHLTARDTFVEVEGVTQPAPAPRFSRTPGEAGALPRPPGSHTVEVLTEWGFDPTHVDALLTSGAAAQPPTDL